MGLQGLNLDQTCIRQKPTISLASWDVSLNDIIDRVTEKKDKVARQSLDHYEMISVPWAMQCQGLN